MWAFCFIKKKSVLWRKMDEVRAMNKIEVNLPQEKIDSFNDAHQEELQYWKKIALESNLNKDQRKQLTDLVPLRVFLARKAAIKNDVKNWRWSIRFNHAMAFWALNWGKCHGNLFSVKGLGTSVYILVLFQGRGSWLSIPHTC